MYPMHKIIDIELDKWIYVASQVRPTLLALHASSKGKHEGKGFTVNTLHHS